MNARSGLLGILVIALLLAIGFAAMIPPDNDALLPRFRGLNPDENDHLDYVRRLVENRGFVVFLPRTPGYVETYQSPLYYLLCVPAFLLGGGGIVAVRLVGALLQLGTVLVCFRAVRDFFPGRRELAIGVAAVIALLPTQAQLSGAVNNDNLTTLLGAAVFWRLGLLVLYGQTVRGALLLGGLLAAGLLTKISFLQLFPAVALAYALAILTLPGGVATALRRGASAVLLALALASPWLIRNTMLYGDPFTMKIFPLTAPASTPTPQIMMDRLGWSFGEYVLQDARRTWATFFYILPPNGPIAPQPGPFLLVAGLGVVGLLGSVLAVVRGSLQAAGERRLLVLAAGTLFSLGPFFVLFNLRFFQAQGRYFYPALLPAALLLVVGISEGAGERRRVAAIGALCVVLLVMSALQLLALGQAF
jgi:4-amino-4-deoxy-L-arabinose transferase-like glycosyltransferase